MRVVICVPTYNEKDNVENLATEILNEVPAFVDILFVDDNSPDGTGVLIKSLCQKNSRIFALHREKKEGLGRAYVAAFQWALQNKYDWVFEMDADFSHDPKHLKGFLEVIQKGEADAVLGSRYITGGGVLDWNENRVLLSQLGSLYARFWLRFNLTDWTGGFNAWSARVLQNICLENIKSRGYTFQIELKFRSLVWGFKLVEMPIVFKERKFGLSKMSGSIVKEAIGGVISLRLKENSASLFKA